MISLEPAAIGSVVTLPAGHRFDLIHAFRVASEPYVPKTVVAIAGETPLRWVRVESLCRRVKPDTVPGWWAQSMREEVTCPRCCRKLAALEASGADHHDAGTGET